MEDGISHVPLANEALSHTSARSSLDSNNKATRDDDITPVSEKELSTDEPSFLSHLALPLGLLIGSAIIGGTTYALIARVNNLIANAAVDGDIEKWKQTARTGTYDACYLGCNSCNDPNFVYSACQLTARADVKGVICDGNKMWNWAAADRYPESCLAAVGQLLMGNELERIKQGYRNQLALITVTVLGGILGGVIAYFLWRRLTMSNAYRDARKSSSRSVLRPKTWKRTKHIKLHEQRTTTSRRSSSSSSARSSASSSRSQTRLSTIVTASVASFASQTSAYPCTGYSPAQTTYFTSANNTLSGSVHGWISDCQDRKVCTTQQCTTSCTTGKNGKQNCTQKCTEQCRTVTSVVKPARAYVDAVMPRVRECGFGVVDVLNGGWGEMERVGNARLERDWWVTVEVSGFNVTKKGETDEAVWCLWGIGGS
ncbi:hypothetical protein C8A05DRAFT_19838 [Staphylotrichum tortipilum]|uniref:Uncharacterized protein n=1 Tax=Staphylotrichum tortipilum TaxID=2831512 RepID=A0AAN6MAL7_9PEZI|nr:hypothetical protein C8A05DRAFT_19838 [Staphylotrichum longicolle]